MADIRIIPALGAINVTGSADFRGTGASSVLFVSGSGNVGVGTTNPASKLHVAGAVKATATTGHVFGTSTDTSRALSILNSNLADASSHAITLGYGASNNNQAELSFYLVGTGSASNRLSLGLYNSSDTVNILGTGNVGIGTTNPTYKLDVVGEIGIDSYIRHNDDTDTYIGFNTTDSFKIRTGNGDRVIVDNNGTYVSGQFSQGVSIANKILNYGAEFRSSGASIQIVYGRDSNATGSGAIGADENSIFSAWNIDSGASEKFRIGKSGAIQAYYYGSGTVTGTAAYGLAVDSSGNIIETTLANINGSGTANYVPKWSDSDTLTNSLIYDNGTNIGIGYSSPDYKLKVAGDIYANTVSYANAGFRTTAANTGYSLITRDSADVNYALYVQNAKTGSQAVIARFAYGDTSANAGTQVLSIGGTYSSFTNTYLGIGTDTPVARLHIAGAGGAGISEARIEATTNASFGILRFTGDASTYEKYLIAYNSAHPSQANQISLKNTAGDISFFTGISGSATEYVRVTAGGSVGIGTSIPSTKLNVIGNATIGDGTTNNYLRVYHDDTSDYVDVHGYGIEFNRGTNYIRPTADNTKNLFIGYNESNLSWATVRIDALNTIFYSSGTESARLNTSGNLGIGTSSPARHLHVNDSSGFAAIQVQASASQDSFIEFVSTNTVKVGIDASENVFKVANTNFSGTGFVMDTTGKVGIGTTAPAHKLDVYENGADAIIRIHEDAGTHNARLQLRSGGNDTWLQNLPGSFEIRTESNLVSGPAPLSISTDGNVSLGYDLDVTGIITAKEFHTTFVSASIIYQSGSTKFGNSTDDDHDFTGSINLMAQSGASGLTISRGGDLYMSMNSDSSRQIFTYGTNLDFRNINGTSRMYLSGSGNVGIGTNAPSFPLTVVGVISGSSNILAANNIYAAGAAGFVFGRSTSEGAYIYRSGADIRVRANGADVLTVDGSGLRVGIGNTAPVGGLRVDSTSGILSTSASVDAYNINVFEEGTAVGTGVGTGIAFTQYSSGDLGAYTTYTPGAAIVHERVGGNSQGGLIFRVKPTTASTGSLTDALYIKYNSSIGIGTTAPAKKLDVVGTSETSIRLKDTGGAAIELYQQATDSYILASNALRVYAGGSERFQFKSNGAIRMLDYGSGTNTGTQAYNLAVDSSGNIIEAGIAVDGSGSANYIPKWSDSDTLTNSVIYESSGEIGINTTSPSANLHVYSPTQNVVSYFQSGDAEAWISLKDSNSGTYGVLLGHDPNANELFKIADSNAYERLIMTTGGDVSIGDRFLPQARLHVSGASDVLLVEGSGSTIVDIQGSVGQLFSVTDSLSGSLMSVNDISGIPILEVFSDDRVVAGQFGSNALVVNGANVGIGTSAPTQKLEVSGSIKLSGYLIDSFNEKIHFDTNDLKVEGKHINAEYGVWARSYGTTRQMGIDGGAAYMGLYTSGTEKVRIDTNGSVGIGTTNPYAKLQVSGALHVGSYSAAVTPTTGMLIETPSGTDAQLLMYVYGSSVFSMKSDGANANIGWGSSANRTVNFVNTGTGNISVGIGTSSPATKLHVVGATGEIARFSAADTTTGAADTGAQITIGGHDGVNPRTFGYIAGLKENGTSGNYAGYLSFATRANGGSSTEKVRITSDGNVGINTTSPTGKFNSYISATRQISHNGNGGDLAVISDNNSTPVFYVKGTGTADLVNVFADTSEVFTINSDGNIGINQSGPTSKLHIVSNVTTTEADIPASFAIQIDSNHSGTDTATADREQGAIYIDVDSSTTGGNTSNEHRLYGIYTDVRASGDPDVLMGGSFTTEFNGTAGTLSTQAGVYGGATSDASTAGSTVTYFMGVYGVSSVQDTGAIGTAYAVRGFNNVAANRVTDISTVIGVEGEVQLDQTTPITIGSVIGVRSIIDVNQPYTSSGAYLFYGDYTGTTYADTRYGVYIVDDVNNYFGGNVGIGVGSPDAKLHVNYGTGGSDIVFSANNKIKIAGDGTLRWGSAADYGKLTWDTDKAVVRGESGKALSLGANGTQDHLWISTAGNIGIGNTTPLRKLHVVGDLAVNASGSQYYGVYINGVGEGADPNILIGDWHNASANLTWDSSARALIIDTQYSTGAGTFKITGNDQASTFLTIGTTGETSFGIMPDYQQTGVIKITRTDGTDRSHRLVAYNTNVAADNYLRFDIHNGNVSTYQTALTLRGDGSADFAGDINVDGIITAKEFHTTFVSASIIYQSGSTQFGDTTDDIHQFTGSLDILTDTTAGNRSFIISGLSGPRLQRRSATGGWAFEYGFNANDDTNLGGFGAYSGISNGLGRYYIGTYSSGERVSILDNGNVGIGVTNPGAKLHVNDDVIRVVNSTYAGIESHNSNGTWESYVGTESGGGGSRYNNASSLHTFYANSTAVVVISGSDGKVGIGTTNPTEKLTVVGELYFPNVSTTDGTNVISFSESTDKSFSFKGYYNGTGASGNKFGIGSNVSGWAANIMTWRGDGNVGIGTVTPDYPLHIYRSGTSPTLLTLHNYNADISPGNGNYIEFKMTDDNATATPQVKIGMVVGTEGGSDDGIATEGDGNFVIQTMDATDALGGGTLAERMRVTHTGKVGIGTSDPADKLHVNSGNVRITNNSPILYFYDTDVSGLYHRILGGGNAGLEYSADIGNVTTGYHRWDIANSEKMRLTEGGNLGIGTASPTAGLHVSKSMGGAWLASLENQNDSGHGLIIRAGGTTGTRYITQWYDAAGNERFHMDDTGEAYFQNSITAGSSIAGASLYTDEYIYHTGDTNTYFRFDTDVAQVFAGGVEMMRWQETTQDRVVVNINQADVDFYVGTQANLYSIYADGATGNVGINTSAPSGQLHVYNDESWSAQDLGSTSSGSVAFRITGRAGATRDFVISSNGSENYTMQVASGITGTGQIHMNPFGGNVGIGVTNPGSKLYVGGTFTATGASQVDNTLRVDGDLTIKGGATNHSIIKFEREDSTVTFARIGFSSPTAANSSFLISSAGNGNPMVLEAGASDSISFQSSGSSIVEYGRFDGNGNLGVNTSSPQAKLHVNLSGTSGTQTIVAGLSSDSLRPVLQFSEGTGIAINAGMSIEYDGRGSGVTNRMYINSVDGNPQFTVMSGGNVGIGNTEPTARLLVHSSVSAYATSLATSVTTGSVHFRTHAGDSTITTFGAIDGGQGYIQRSNGAGTTSYGLALNPWGGNVGIGVTDPGKTLDINGTFRVQTDFTNPTLTSITYAQLQTLPMILSDTSLENTDGEVVTGIGFGYSNEITAGIVATDRGGSAAQSLDFITGISTGVASRMSIIQDGNVGIGVTDPAAKLEIDGTLYIDAANNSGSIQLGASADYPNLGKEAQLHLAGGTNYHWNLGGKRKIFISDYDNDGGSGVILFEAEDENNTTDIKFTGRYGSNPSIGYFSGRVGIAETNPSYPLHVTGKIYSTTEVQGGSAVINDTGGISVFGSNTSTRSIRVGRDGSSNDIFITGSSGFVGIGTDSPAERLHTYGTSPNIRLTNSNWKNGTGTQGGPHISFHLGGNSSEQSYAHARIQSIDRYTTGGAFHGALAFLTSTAGTLGERMRIEYDGRVGIGTDNPGAKLHIYNTSGDGDLILRGSSAGGQILRLDQNSIRTTTASQLAIFTNSTTTNGFYITSDGKIGAGLTAPQAKLHVSGTSDVFLVEGSGSTILDVQGSQGQLFSIDDSLSGSLMSVNDISGIPILEVFSSDRVVMGTFGQNTLVVNGSNVGIGESTPIAKLQIGGGTSGTTNRSTVAMFTGTSTGGVVDALNLVNNATATYSNGTALNFNNASNYTPTGRIIVQQVASGTITDASMVFQVYQSGLKEALKLNPNQSVTFNESFTFPTGDGSSGQALITNGSGTVSWGSPTAGSAARVNTVLTNTNANYYLTFVDSNNATATAEDLYTSNGLYVNPASDSIYATGNIISYASSDKSLKDNLTPIENAIEKLSKVSGYEFDWNDKQVDFQGHDIGVVAQEIEEILPEIVTTRSDGYKAVKYEKLTALLIQGVKEQQGIIQHQQSEIDTLRQEIESIKQLLTQKP